jgi:hypothetical protein
MTKRSTAETGVKQENSKTKAVKKRSIGLAQ